MLSPPMCVCINYPNRCEHKQFLLFFIFHVDVHIYMCSFTYLHVAHWCTYTHTHIYLFALRYYLKWSAIPALQMNFLAPHFSFPHYMHTSIWFLLTSVSNGSFGGKFFSWFFINSSQIVGEIYIWAKTLTGTGSPVFIEFNGDMCPNLN